MSEEEIIKEVKGYLDFENGIGIKAIQGLLDLYNKEKEKNKELQEYMKEYLIPKSIINFLYISKDKIKEKIDEKNIKMAEQLKIIQEFGEHEKNRAKLTMYKEQRDAYIELLQ